MEAKKFTTAQRKALEALLDDSSPTVRAALLAQLARHGQESVDFLRALARQPNRLLALHAARYLRELNFSDPVGEFRTFIRSLNYELETGALLLSRTVNADLDVGACCAQLDTLAARCRELIAEPATAREKCRVLNRVLFHEHGLRGNADHYTDPLNSFLDQVLIRRKGIPLSLSLVYLLVAERVGLQLEAVALPGHFMVGCYEEDVPFFIDPFNAGVFLTAGEVFILLRQEQRSRIHRRSGADARARGALPLLPQSREPLHGVQRAGPRAAVRGFCRRVRVHLRAARAVVKSDWFSAANWALLPAPMSAAPEQIHTLADLEQWSFAGTALAVIGRPVAHSLSPVIHNAALAELAKSQPKFKDWRYFKFDIAPEELPRALGLFHKNRFHGLNLTVPHKALAVDHLVASDAYVRAAGAANTLTYTEPGWRGANTDCFGLSAALKQDLGVELGGADVILLGAGGAARAAAVECLRQHCASLWIGNRTPATLNALLGDLRMIAGETILRGFDPKNPPTNCPPGPLCSTPLRSA